MSEWIDLLPVVETWAKEQGCQSVRVYGRRGWARVIGYQVDYTKMSKKL